MGMSVEIVGRQGLWEVLPLLEDFLRDGEALPEGFVREVEQALDSGEIFVFAASVDGKAAGVLTLETRLSFALGGNFASVEDLYVAPEYRGRGIGQAMISATEVFCSEKGISYVEVQVEADEARRFYENVGYVVEEGIKVMSRSQVLGRSSTS